MQVETDKTDRGKFFLVFDNNILTFSDHLPPSGCGDKMNRFSAIHRWYNNVGVFRFLLDNSWPDSSSHLHLFHFSLYLLFLTTKGVPHPTYYIKPCTSTFFYICNTPWQISMGYRGCPYQHRDLFYQVSKVSQIYDCAGEIIIPLDNCLDRSHSKNKTTRYIRHHK